MFSPEKLHQLTLQVTKIARDAGDFQLIELKNFELKNIVRHFGR